MPLQFYTILHETSVCAYVMAYSYGYALDKILKFCFCFLFCELKLFHDSSYIFKLQRQTKSGRDINSLNLLVTIAPEQQACIVSDTQLAVKMLTKICSMQIFYSGIVFFLF